jgi:hypothetical protein
MLYFLTYLPIIFGHIGRAWLATVVRLTLVFITINVAVAQRNSWLCLDK